MSGQNLYTAKEEVEPSERSYNPPEVLRKFAFWGETKTKSDGLENIADSCLLCNACKGGCGDV